MPDPHVSHRFADRLHRCLNWLYKEENIIDKNIK